MLIKLNDITKYFGFLTVFLEWSAVLILALIQTPNLAEPFSQYGYYSSTQIVFGLSFTIAAIVCYLYSRHLDAYWQYTSITILAAGVFFVITGWYPYTPGAGAFLFDLHNLAIVLAVILYSTPMLFIGFKKAHARIARASLVLYILMFILVLWSLIARVLDIGIIYAQLASVVPFHVWLITTNILLLKHQKEVAPGHTGKL